MTFVADLARTRSAATASVRFRALQQFFTWLLDEEEIDRSPLERMKPPVVPEQPVDVVAEEDLRRLPRGLDGKGFLSRRDNAAVRLFLDTGLRRAELASITVPDVDLDTRTVSVLGRGAGPASSASAHGPRWPWTATAGSGLASPPPTWLPGGSESAGEAP